MNNSNRINPHVERRVLVVDAGDAAEVRDVRSDQQVRHRARSITIRLHEGAQLSYVDLQQLSDMACELTVITVIMDAYSSFTYEGLHTGARYAKTMINLCIEGEGAQATVHAGSLATGDQRHCFITMQQHRAPCAMSRCTVRAAVYDRACVQYHGSIEVAEHAQKTEAYQQAKSLLMGTAARSFARPSLDIKAHDVQCAHGAATGQLDEELLWYLQSRGVEREEAQRRLVGAFFDDLYSDEHVRGALYIALKTASHLE